MEDEGEEVRKYWHIWPDYPRKDDFLFNGMNIDPQGKAHLELKTQT